MGEIVLFDGEYVLLDKEFVLYDGGNGCNVRIRGKKNAGRG